MSVLDDSEIGRVLVIAAHPDDVDFGSAGTIARWTDAGIDVIYCIVTDGEAGGSDPGISRADMATLRRGEQRAAAKQVGVHDLRFLGYPDGRVEATLELRRDLARVIRQVRPDRVVCPAAERNYARAGASHPDHRAVGSAALDAVYPDARNQFAFPELLAEEDLAAWTVREVRSATRSASTSDGAPPSRAACRKAGWQRSSRSSTRAEHAARPGRTRSPDGPARRLA